MNIDEQNMNSMQTLCHVILVSGVVFKMDWGVGHLVNYNRKQ